MRIVGLHHAQITIPPGSEPEARTFYLDLLGLRETAKPSNLIARGGFWMEVGDRQVHVGVEDRSGLNRSKAHLAYIVDSLEDYRDLLTRNGFDILEGEPIPGLKRFETRDPFGNRLEFIQPAA